MITKHLILGFTFGLSISVISWIVGMIGNSMLLKTAYYKKLENFNFVTSKTLNSAIGLPYFKWIVKNTFFKFFNESIKINDNKVDLNDLRHQMTLSEISHLIGFVFVTLFAIYKCFTTSVLFGISMMIANAFLNLFPSLLQQENKRRIDRLIKRQKG